MWLKSVVWDAKTVRMVRPAIGDATAIQMDNNNMTCLNNLELKFVLLSWSGGVWVLISIHCMVISPFTNIDDAMMAAAACIMMSTRHWAPWADVDSSSQMVEMTRGNRIPIVPNAWNQRHAQQVSNASLAIRLWFIYIVCSTRKIRVTVHTTPCQQKLQT